MSLPAHESASNYRPICQLAVGGMGVVELAVRQEGRFRRLYAVKRLREAYRDDADVREMFLDEARIAGLVRHPNVVSVLDVGEDEDGPFLVMDYVEGVSAATLITHASKAGHEIPLQVCLRVGMEAAEGLHAAHELKDARGEPMYLVHRDVSPQNILLGYDGVARVTDFGVAKALGRITKTQTGVLKGKFGYMSPELLQFDEPDRRADLFSLGIVLFELISGERLYGNKNGMDGPRRILKEPPPDIGEHRDDVPPELVQLLFSMLAKSPEQRPPDARTVARSLERMLAELVSMEGRIETGEYLAREFAGRRVEQQQNVEAALATAGAAKVPALGEGLAPRKGRRLGLGVAIAAILLAGGLAYGAAAWLDGAPRVGPVDEAPSEAATAPVETSGEGEAPSDIDPEGQPRPESPVAESVQIEDAAEDQPSAEASDPERDPTQDERARIRARRRAAAAARAMAGRDTMSGTGGSGVPMWSWM